MIANVTPTQLYGRLLGSPTDPVSTAGRRFRYGRSEMQIHFALSEPPRWEGDERLGRTAIVHVTPGLDGVSRAVNEAERGLLPAEATIVCGQPLTIDPEPRARRPGHALDPAPGAPVAREGRRGRRARHRRRRRGRRSSASDTPTASRRASRGTSRTSSPRCSRARRSPRPTSRRRTRTSSTATRTPGSLALDQNFVWRPFAGQPGHRTPVDRLWHIGASTWPGPGLGAGSGTLVAQELLRPPARTRLLRRLPGVGTS